MPIKITQIHIKNFRSIIDMKINISQDNGIITLLARRMY